MSFKHIQTKLTFPKLFQIRNESHKSLHRIAFSSDSRIIHPKHRHIKLSPHSVGLIDVVNNAKFFNDKNARNDEMNGIAVAVN